MGKIVPAKVRWVITVPALWSEEHKYFMRKAAVDAGIVECTNSSNLLLCLEVKFYKYIVTIKKSSCGSRLGYNFGKLLLLALCI